MSGGQRLELQRRTAAVAAGIVILVGVLVCALWLLGIPEATRLVPQSSYVRFNTGLCFVFGGSATLLTLRRHHRWALAAVIPMLLLAGLALAEYVLNRSMAIDEFFIGTRALPYPGQMAPNTAAGMLMAAVALATLVAARSRIWALSISVTLAALSMALALVAVLGYALDLPAAFAWGGFTRMALLTAIALLVLGAGIILATREVARIGSWLEQPWLAITVGVGAAGLGLLASHAVGGAASGLPAGVSSVLDAAAIMFAVLLAGTIAGARHMRLLMQRLAMATESAHIGIWDWDVVADKLVWDTRMYELYGMRGEDFGGAYETWEKGVHPDDRARAKADLTAALERGEYSSEFRVVWPDGEVRDIEARAVIQRSSDGAALRMTGINRDVTLTRRAEGRIKGLNRVYAVLSGIDALIVRASDQAELFAEACRIAVDEGGFRMALIAMVDADGRVVGPIASAGKGPALVQAIRDRLSSSESTAKTMIGMAMSQCRPVISNDCMNDTRLVFSKDYVDAGVRSLAVVPLVRSGAAVGVIAFYAAESGFFHDAEVKLLSELASDISFAIDHIEKSDRLNYLAFYDALTGLANRNLFLERVAQFKAGHGHADRKFAMILIDLVRFKAINDRLGRAAGDSLLKQVATRLIEIVGDASLLARTGADHFALALPDAERIEDVRQYLESAIASFHARPFEIGSAEVQVAARFGVALYPDDGLDADVLFKNAELAVTLAKTTESGLFYYSSAIREQMSGRDNLERELRAAVKADEFVVHYQARVDMTSGRVIGGEALIRWQHPSRGLLEPSDFIALAEETGLVVPIGARVLDRVCAQLAAWGAAGIGIVPIAVNLSPIQFAKDDLLRGVIRALDEHGVDPKYLDLEVTESAVMDDPESAATTLGALRKLGVRVALDDFGTGYSSLAHLKRLPFDSIKIDRSFVIDITTNADDAAIATAIIAMAHRLKLKVVAEGVETQGQFNYLRAHGCDQMQGYLFSRPVDADAFEAALRGGERLTIPSPEPADQRTLLVVDDEPGIRSALVRLFRGDGYRIITASSGAEGLDALAVNDVQVIISDQRMPGMTGAEFLNTVKELYPDTIRIILSGYTDLAVVTESVNRGAVFKFVTKPWDDALLREQVRDGFRRYRRSSAEE